MTPDLLTALIFLPSLGCLLVLLMSGERTALLKLLGLGASVLTFVLALAAWANFDAAGQGFQLVRRIDWIPSLHISYAVGVDGLSLLLVLLTAFLTPLAMLSSWSSVEKNVK